MAKRPFCTVGVAGGTGSGKSTVAQEIARALGHDSVLIIQQDSYYRDLGGLSLTERAAINYDHPDALDWPLFREQVRRVRGGQSIEKPIYDFRTHSRLPETARVEPRPLLILEGILIFHDPELLRAMDIKVYLDTDADVRLLRRLARDMQERGRSLDSVTRQYLDTVRPMHLAYVEPSRRCADIIIPGGGHNRVALEMLIARLRSLLAEQGTVTHAPGAHRMTHEKAADL
jgi:uridine kinase